MRRKLTLRDRIPSEVWDVMGPGVPDAYDGPIYTGDNGARRARDEVDKLVAEAEARAKVDEAYRSSTRRAAEPLPPGVGLNPDY